MDNGFMEDGDMQQMRTRRRFQTGLIILFLLFFMDTRRTSTGQRRASGHRQRATDSKDVYATVKKMGPDFDDPGREAFQFEASYFEGNWKRLRPGEMQMSIPDVEGLPRSVGNAPNAAWIPKDEEGNVKLHMSLQAISEEDWNPHISIITGTMTLGYDVMYNFEGLFFHKYRRVIALVGLVNKDQLKLIWDPSDNSSRIPVTPETDGRLSEPITSTAVRSKSSSEINNATTIATDGSDSDKDREELPADGAVDEDTPTSRRVLEVPTGENAYVAGDAAVVNGYAESKGRETVEGRHEDRDVNRKGKGPSRFEVRPSFGWDALGTREGMEAIDEAVRLSLGDGYDDVTFAVGGTNELFRAERREPRRLIGMLGADDDTLTQTSAQGEISGGSLGMSSVAQSEHALAGKPADKNDVEVRKEAGRRRTGGVEGRIGNRDSSTKNFPAQIVPSNAVVEPGQRAGRLEVLRPVGEGDARCKFMLSMEAQDSGSKGSGVKFVGELAGINCDDEFEASIRLQSSTRSPTLNYMVVFATVCLLQMCLLFCRGRYGRNFLVPRRFQPPKFDYHRPLPAEWGVDQAISETAGGQDSEEGRDLECGRCPECAICYAAVDATLEDYMLTPCDHVFHQACLTRWMSIKMECPTCRHELPPQLD